MNLQRPGFIGASLGVLLGMLLAASAPVFQRARILTGPMLPEHGGTIRQLVMQYSKGSEFVWPVYRQFLQYQAPSVTVYMVCPGSDDFSEIRREIGDVRCNIAPIYTGHPITTWARDRWVELEPAAAGGTRTLLAPKGELQQEIWPQREGDSHVAEVLGRTLSPGIRAIRSDLYFDSGDFLADERFIFATPAVLRRNLQHTVADREELTKTLEHDLRRRVIFMDDAPDHHAGMYMMAAGNGRMVVGDPSLGARRVAMDDASLDAMDGGPDFGAETQRHFDSVANTAAGLGYQVIRIPTVPGRDGKRFLTYVNVIMDVRDGRPIVYMPTYRDQPKLNAAARSVWETMGYEVIAIDCSSLWAQGGTLHCLVNVLDRSVQSAK
jgi:hypothetical protein